MKTSLRTIHRFYRGLRSGFNDPDIRGLFTVVVVLLTTGTFFYHFIEGLSYVDALYFSTTTLVTVGFGDIAPQTIPGKLFTVAYIIIGVGSFIGFTNLIIHHSVEHSRSERIDDEPTKPTN